MLRFRACLYTVGALAVLTTAWFLFWLRNHTQTSGEPPASIPEPSAIQSSLSDTAFNDTVHPFLSTYCTDCHSGAKPKGDLDLSAYAAGDAATKDSRRWETVLEQLETGTMPPAKAKQPPAEMRQKVVAWIRELRRNEAKQLASDPGQAPPHRLSNAEYDYTIRDLTGVDIRPTKEFPVDPANEAGFDNSAESLATSPALLDKFIEAARRVSEHLVLMPDGLAFAPYPVVADTDRDKFCTRRIIDFYKRQRVDYADYFQAAWRFQHRAIRGEQEITLAEIAAKEGLSPKYLATVWALLSGPPEELGPTAALRLMWKELPAPTLPGSTDPAVRSGCERLREFVARLRQMLVPEVKNLTVRGMNNGSQPLVLWKDRQFVANRTRYAPGAALHLRLKELALTPPAVRALTAPAEPAAVEPYESAFAGFCKTFPDAFYISERARVYLDPAQEKRLGGRLLSAGFHSMTGYFRDDGPLYDLVLDRDAQQELDRLWLEFDVVTGAPMRQYTSFIWFERSDSSFIRERAFDFARAEDKDSTSEEKIKTLAEAYLAKAIRNGASEVAQTAIKDHFAIISASIRRVETTRLAAEPKHIASLVKFAERAYRRPLAPAESASLVAFYHALREKDGLNHEDATREVAVSVLMSPRFLFRLEPSVPSTGAQALSDYALASRLSYFLWSSMPDAELLDHAAAGDLHRPDVLIVQAKRMVQDSRIRALATEFAGNWLDFRRFEEHNAVDRERFKSFNDDLRRAMFEEPIRFFIDVVRADRSALDFLYANHTFVNPVLAKHYSIPPSELQPSTPTLKPASDNWVRIDDANRYGRGGLLPMAVFLTKNAPGLRTSPVKRGYWVVRRLLGEKIPAPPAEVPELPADEAKLGDLTLRETLARHRADKSCAGCHERFDSLGLVFERFGPIGERRTVDLGLRPVDDQATFPGGDAGSGLDGLRAYIREHRQDDFLNNLCRKFLAFALGRTLTPSDDELVHSMQRELTAHDYRFGTLIDTIITSPQFLNKRSDAEPANKGTQ